MRVVCMEVKFDPKYKSAVFRAKYLKSEIEFENSYLLCVCRVFCRFSEALEAVLGDLLFNGHATSMSKLVRDKTSHRPLNRISPKTAIRSSEKW